MKKLILSIAICCIATLSFAQENKINWVSFNRAVELCKENPKYILIDVYTDWCGWCKKMDQTTFVDPTIAKYISENYYAVKLDAEGNDTIVFRDITFVNPKQGQRSVHQFAAAILQGKMSYPSYVFMNPKLELLTVVPGYSNAAQFMPILDYFASESYLIMQWNEYQEAMKQQ